jgi:hypothetical protein
MNAGEVSFVLLYKSAGPDRWSIEPGSTGVQMVYDPIQCYGYS